MIIKWTLIHQQKQEMLLFTDNQEEKCQKNHTIMVLLERASIENGPLKGRGKRDNLMFMIVRARNIQDQRYVVKQNSFLCCTSKVNI